MEMLTGAAIGALWTALLAAIVIDAAAEDLGPERLRIVPVHPETMFPWTNHDWLMAVVDAASLVSRRAALAEAKSDV